MRGAPSNNGLELEGKGVRYLSLAYTIGTRRAELEEAFGHRVRRGMAVASLRSLTFRPLMFKERLALPDFRRHDRRAMLPGAR